MWTTEWVGRVREWGKVGETIACIFFFFLHLEDGHRGGRGLLPAVQTGSQEVNQRQ